MNYLADIASITSKKETLQPYNKINRKQRQNSIKALKQYTKKLYFMVQKNSFVIIFPPFLPRYFFRYHDSRFMILIHGK